MNRRQAKKKFKRRWMHHWFGRIFYLTRMPKGVTYGAYSRVIEDAEKEYVRLVNEAVTDLLLYGEDYAKRKYEAVTDRLIYRGNYAKRKNGAGNN